MLPIQTKLTAYNKKETNGRNIQGIVIHTVGAVSSAKNNVDYYASKYLGASAHYFCDQKEIWQSVKDKDVAWHCGTAKCYTQKHPTLRNSNTIGIEMCQDTPSTVAADTINNTADLVQYLMNKYKIPVEMVVRHWDVVNKKCPFMYIDDTKWNELKKTLTGQAGAAACPNIQPSNTGNKTSPLYNRDIQELQQALNADGFKDWEGKSLQEDGIWGSRTSAAVKKVLLSVKTIRSSMNVTRWLQQRIGTDADGLFGNKTKEAVKAFQAKHGLAVDGIAGKNTMLAMVRVYVPNAT